MTNNMLARLVIVGLVGVLAFSAFSAQRANERDERAAARHPVTMELEPFDVELVGSGEPRAIRATISLIISDQEAEDTLSKTPVKEYVHDQIFMLVRQESGDLISSSERRTAIEHEIAQQVLKSTGVRLIHVNAKFDLK